MVVDVMDEALRKVLSTACWDCVLMCPEECQAVILKKIRAVFEHERGWFTVEWPNQWD